MSDEPEHDRYRPGEHRSLSEAILNTIARYHGKDLLEMDFRLYDDINPDALNNLFREDADGNATVQFSTNDVTVTLVGDDGVDIHVTGRDDIR